MINKLMENYLDILPKSLWVTTCNSGSCNGCDIEIVACISPRYDIERFGMKLVGTPRHADVLIVTGPVTKYMTDRLRRIYDQMPPKGCSSRRKLRVVRRRILQVL